MRILLVDDEPHVLKTLTMSLESLGFDVTPCASPLDALDRSRQPENRFDLGFIDEMHPRLAGARELLSRGAVTITRRAPIDATVASADVLHRIREVEGELHCTCPWFAKHQGQRGPCKHVLAVRASAQHSESG